VHAVDCWDRGVELLSRTRDVDPAEADEGQARLQCRAGRALTIVAPEHSRRSANDAGAEETAHATRREAEGSARTRLSALQETAGNRAVAGALHVAQRHQTAAIQRSKGDKHSGVYVKRPSDAQFMIKVDSGMRPLWFAPPSGHGLAPGQSVTFTEGEGSAVTELVAGAVPKTYLLFDARTEISDADIAKGTLQPIAGRTSGDVELVIESGMKTITIHVHPYAGSRETPTGGGVKIGSTLSKDNAPQAVVDKIAERADFEDVVKKAAGATGTSAATREWRK
jgi:hypothetical protein